MNIEKKLIAHLQLLPILSGVQKVTLDEFMYADRLKFNFFLICKEYGDLPKLSQNLGISTYYAKSLTRNISLINDIKSFIEIYSILRKNKPDIIHTHSSKTGFLGRLCGALLGIPVIHTVHGFPFDSTVNVYQNFLYYFIEYIAGKISTYIIVLNKTDKNIAVNKLMISPDKVRLVPNGVNVDIFEALTPLKNNLRKTIFNTDGESIIIGMVGRLWRQKNPKFLVSAFISICLNYPNVNVKLVIVGDGDLYPSIAALINEYNLEDKIILMGWRDDIPEILTCLDIFVLPSLWEGMPLAILEAMAARLPIIASDIAGNRDLVAHAKNGYLYDVGDQEALIYFLLDLINNSTRRKIYGETSHFYILKKYLLKNRINSIQLLYQSSER